MSNNTYNPKEQQKNLSSKIVVGLERISEVFKIMLWEKAKQVGLSPIQIQILIFISSHKQDLCKVSHLAKEFNITKPTVSDAIKVLDKKGIILKQFSPSDNRSYSIFLSKKGKEIVNQTFDFSNTLKDQIDEFSTNEQESLFETLSTLIYKLNRSGVLSVQRICFGCKFYRKNNEEHYCNLLKQTLLKTDIRIDCPEFIEI